MKHLIGIIGGSGLNALEGLHVGEAREVETRWGAPSAVLRFGSFAGADVVFLARHGEPHAIPPHRINYRANIQAFKDIGVKAVFAGAAVGGLAGFAGPGRLVVPDQIIDYTWGRASTFHDDRADDAEGGGIGVTHVDFAHPYDPNLRRQILKAGQGCGVALHDGGCYGTTQGPRLETAAEVRRMQRDGCDLVGMTGMPEAALAREAGLKYVSVNVVTNWGAGLGVGGGEAITLDAIERVLQEGMADVRKVLATWLGKAADGRTEKLATASVGWDEAQRNPGM